MKGRAAIAPKALDITEQAFHVVRRNVGALLPAYAIGSVPFVLSLVYFYMDMAYSAFARDHVAPLALAVALLFVWMKVWHTIFALRVRSLVRGEAIEALGWRRIVRIIQTQLVVQATGFVVLPIAVVSVVGGPAVYAFYQSMTVEGDGQDDSLFAAVRRAGRQALRWPTQNLIIMWILSPLLLIIATALSFAVSPVLYAIGSESASGSMIADLSWTMMILTYLLCLPLSPLGVTTVINLLVVITLLPSLFETFFGVQLELTRTLGSSSTTFLLVVAFTYLCLDPIAKAAYVLRCHYGDSLSSGADLSAQWREAVARAARVAGVVLVIGAAFFAGTAAFAQEAEPVVSPDELGGHIEEVLRQSEYSWRMPREVTVVEGNRGPLMSFLFDIAEALADGLRWLGGKLDKLFAWLRSFFREQQGGEGGGGLSVDPQVLSVVLIIAGVAILGYLAYRIWRTRPVAFQKAEAFEPASPDLEQEDLLATDYPEDTWVALARDLQAQRQYRPALRAYFLAKLALLGTQGLIQIAKFKSNREYQWELQRRSHALPELIPLFGDDVRVFEGVWYGTRVAEQDAVEHAAAAYERMRSIARPQG